MAAVAVVVVAALAADAWAADDRPQTQIVVVTLPLLWKSVQRPILLE